MYYLLIPFFLFGYSDHGISQFPNIVYSTQESCIKEGEKQKSRINEFESISISYDYLCAEFDPALNNFNNFK